MERFRSGTGLYAPPQEMQVEFARAVGAYEVYSYLLSMNEEDVNE